MILCEYASQGRETRNRLNKRQDFRAEKEEEKKSRRKRQTRPSGLSSLPAFSP